MEVFISWSGDRSRKVAEALRDWLPSVIQSVSPFISSDIEKGSRWADDLATHLGNAQFGLICLTQDNLEAPWLLFEAGALSKSIDNSRVVPYLYGVSQAQIEGPLAQFQAAHATKDSTLDVIESINEASGEDRLEPTRLGKAFETWWPHLETTLDSIPETAEEAPPSRADRDILEEILGLCRQMLRPGTPNTEIEQEALRNLVAHGLHAEPVDLNEGLDAESRQLPIETARRGTLRLQLERRRQLERLRQIEHNIRQQDLETRRRIREEYPQDNRPPSEGEIQSSTDSEKEA